MASARLLAKLGYVAFRFDMRGCGESEGTRGRVICLEQVEDTRHALSFLATRPDVDGQRIGVMGHSFGAAAVAIYAAGVDRRVAACISSGGWGDGEKILMPGERAHRTLEQRTREGIPLPRAVIVELDAVAARLGVAMFASSPRA